MKLSTLIGFATLFHGRDDAFFDSDNNRTAYYYKGSKRYTRRINLSIYRAHLMGRGEIGTYPVRDDSSCRWSCIDIDEENYEKALDVQAVWRFFGVEAWIERSRSKGYHVWVFVEKWVSSSTLRKAGLYVAEIAEIPGVEVNPKNLAPWRVEKFINTVRLPYSGKANPGKMTVLNDGGNDLSLEAFVSYAMAQRASESALRTIAKRYDAMEQARRLKALSLENAQTHKGLPQAWNGSQDAFSILEGKRDIGNGERDNQFFTIANILKASGTELELALRTVARIYEKQCLDKTGFNVEDAMAKVYRVYGG